MAGLTLPLLHAYVAGGAFAWAPHYEVLVWLFLIEGLYLFGIARLHERSPRTRPIPAGRIMVFTAGVLTLWIAAATPLDGLSDGYLISAHMLQHLIFTTVSPPLLLVGLPAWLVRPLLCRRGVFAVMRFLTRPLIAFTIFNLALLFVHLPPAITLELQHEETVHFGAHLLLIVTALLMWWPVLSPLPELPRLSYPMQLVYLFVQSFLPAVLSAFLIFTSSVIYPFYLTSPKIWGISPIDDQRLGGAIMKLGGTAIIWTLMGVIFFRWFNEEERREPAVPAPPEPIVWEDVEEELTRMGLTKH
jgi:putative membrane protein